MSLTVATTYAFISCCECGLSFAVSEKFKADLRRSGNEFWCPNGHKQRYTETTADKLRKELQREKEAHERTRSCVHSADQRTEAEKRSHSATKGKLTKTHNRIKRGVCPFCNRSFENLRRHMETKHSDSCHS